MCTTSSWASTARSFFDDVLAPVFGEVAEVDWAAHIPKLIDYWCQVLLGHPGYVAAMPQAHREVHEIEPFQLGLFDRWNALFIATLDASWSGPTVDTAKDHAKRVGRVLALQQHDDDLLEGGAYAVVMAVRRSRKARAARKRKKRMDRVEHDLRDEQWNALEAAWGGCAYCGATDKPLQRDCVLALSRGGRYTLDNIAPACGSCNASKCNEEVTGWLRRKRLDERAFLLRHFEIKTALALRFPAEPDDAPDAPEAHR